MEDIAQLVEELLSKISTNPYNSGVCVGKNFTIGETRKALEVIKKACQ